MSINNNILPPPMSRANTLGDIAMRPLMRLLGGFRPDSLQETHVWHPHRIDPAVLDMSMTAEAPHQASAKARRLFLFHVPAIPGLDWKDYSVVRATESPFYIGWTTRNRENNTHIDTAVHRLLLMTDTVRMLNGPKNEETRFFGVNERGEQIPVSIIEQGKLGTNAHRDIRLL